MSQSNTMPKRCVCGIILTLPNTFVLDCKHILCQACSRVWAAVTSCPRCHIEDALERLPISSANENILCHLARFLCIKARELWAEKKSALLLENFSMTSPVNISLAGDDIIPKSSANVCINVMGRASQKAGTSGGHKRKADDDNTLIDSELSVTPPFNVWKRQRITTTPEADCAMITDVDKEHVLLRKIEELKSKLENAHLAIKSQEKMYKERLEAMKRRTEEVAKKTKDISSEAARSQAEKMKDLISDFDDQYLKLAAADKIIQQLNAKVENNKSNLRKAEKKAAEFEAWGRQTKAHYQDIIKQMEANQLRLGSTVGTPSHAREYAKELPSLRRVHHLNHDRENQFTPKKCIYAPKHSPNLEFD